MTLTVTLGAEDGLAAAIAGRLLDRIVGDRASGEWLREYWSDAELRKTQRRMVDFEGRAGWSNPSTLSDLGRRHGHHLRAHGKPDSNPHHRPLLGNAARAYKYVLLAAVMPFEEPRALLLAFDADGKPDHERYRAGVHAAVRERTFPFAILVAEAHPEFDAWVLAGFVPASRRDHDALAAVRTSLRNAGHAFDPLAEPHRLTSTIADDPRDAKQLCARLLDLSGQAHLGEPAVQRCIDELPLSAPVSAALGLTAFVDDIVRGVLPLLGDPPQRDR